MRANIHNIIGPYDGPFERNILTYKLRLSCGKIVAWHENGRRGFIKGLNKGDMISGLALDNKAERPNYKKSKIKLECKQLNLL
tara:strand:- start:6533 stop:6781 length:249 start_codon:yes stop_codon:yes gene_type:complete